MYTRRIYTALAVGAAVAGVVPVALAGASAPPESAATADFCAAELAMEVAFNGDDPSAIGPAVGAAQAVVPADIAGDFETAIANAPTDGPPSEAFMTSYNAVVAWMKDNCGFNVIEVLAQDYSYGGIGGEVASGPTIISLDNQGTEYHEMIVLRRNDGVTEPVEELMALPEEELFSKVTFLNAAFAAPGAIGGTVVDLTPGEYIGLCFIPEGTTQEAYDAMMAAMPTGDSAAPGTPPAPESTPPAPEGTAPVGSGAEEGEGPPHFALGMIVEFSAVEGGGSADAGSMAPMDHSTMVTAPAGTDA